MAFGVPGGSSNMTYFVLCGGGLTAAVVYVSVSLFSLSPAGQVDMDTHEVFIPRQSSLKFNDSD